MGSDDVKISKPAWRVDLNSRSPVGSDRNKIVKAISNIYLNSRSPVGSDLPFYKAINIDDFI